VAAALGVSLRACLDAGQGASPQALAPSSGLIPDAGGPGGWGTDSDRASVRRRGRGSDSGSDKGSDRCPDGCRLRPPRQSARGARNPAGVGCREATTAGCAHQVKLQSAECKMQDEGVDGGRELRVTSFHLPVSDSAPSVSICVYPWLAGSAPSGRGALGG
jgi:hypothetical protein